MYNINETYTDDMGFSVKHISGMGQSKSALPHIHSSKKFLFVYCEKGAGGYVINGKNHIIEDGEIVILKPSEFFLHYITKM